MSPGIFSGGDGSFGAPGLSICLANSLLYDWPYSPDRCAPVVQPEIHMIISTKMAKRMLHVLILIFLLIRFMLGMFFCSLRIFSLVTYQ